MCCAFFKDDYIVCEIFQLTILGNIKIKIKVNLGFW